MANLRGVTHQTGSGNLTQAGVRLDAVREKISHQAPQAWWCPAGRPQWLRKEEKSGARFSLKAVMPSWASAESPNSLRLEKAICPIPAKCSVSMFIDCFSTFRAVGDSRRISSAQDRTSALSWSAGTTLLTRPHASACSALYWRHRNQISRGRFSPINRARYPGPKPASYEPTRGPFWPNRAVSAAMVRSHRTCSTCPPPMAKPLTAAITGLGTSLITRCSASISNSPLSDGPESPVSIPCFWSPPVQNAFSPAPVRQMTPTSSLLQARLKHATSSSTVRARKELYRSGRLIVIQARPWSTSYVTSVSWSISRCRPSLAGAVAAKENYPRKRSFSSYRPPSDRE